MKSIENATISLFKGGEINRIFANLVINRCKKNSFSLQRVKSLTSDLFYSTIISSFIFFTILLMKESVIAMNTPINHLTAGFIGLGLIGGSIAKAIRKYHPDYHILAYNRSKEALASAISTGIIDGVCEEMKDPRFGSCDYVFLCAPVEINLECLAYLKEIRQPGCIITDVGSVKGIIHQKVERILENAYYILTPGGEVGLEYISDFTELISSLGAIPMVLTAEEHDFITAGVSHLPHIIASALVNLVKTLDNDAEYMKTIAAGGFRDITRIASSSPVMWQQICMENHENISNVLDDYIRMLIQIRCSVDNCATDGKEADAIYQMFASSRDYRDSIDVVDNGPIRKAYVLYLDIADEAGGIATIATILAMDKISIKNIGIIHNREFEQGVLKIEFYEEDAMEKAIALLKKRNYIVYER